MPGLMGDDANHLVGRIGAHQRSNMKEYVAPIHHKSIEGALPYQMNANILPAHPRCLENGAGIDAQQAFDFRIPNQTGISGRRGCGNEGE